MDAGLRQSTRRSFLGAALGGGLSLFGLTAAASAAPLAHPDGVAGPTNVPVGGGIGARHSLVELRKSTTSLVDKPIPLDRGLVTPTNTPQIVTHVVGPVDLHPGDRVLVTAREEFSNPNAVAKGAWTVDGIKSEHWSLWVMAAIGVMRGTSLSPSQAYWVRRQTAENWDALIHHKTMDVAEWDLIDRELRGVYYFTVCYFASSPNYRPAGAEVVVEQSDYGKLEAAIFRAA